ncbi:hypothetical protein MC7420_3629 [Coleofasciculus chthonoplastes PCC 7420]|uniref:Uncharacterized protein n=1 Tax=Coleofasciculus chthonoplastes PCC 7420 TaxID=118168 RepID=B4VX99_9CYAN|nr:hypothetical protein [Coleofasciculus chthonoplastes]EDX73455.1 hypothetical protein MC7420_3629 [Coleofasciculus chthonoplastes PCC 7420]
MRRHTLVVLSITTAVFGLVPLAQAQSDSPFSANDNSVTLSGESLRTVQRRSLSKDYRSFFNTNSPIAPDAAGVNSTDSSFAISDRLRIVVGDTLNSGDPLDLFPAVGEEGDVQRLKLQVPLRE